MREQRSAQLLAPEKRPAREAKLVTRAIRDEYDMTQAAATGMNPADPRLAVGNYFELAQRGEGLPRR